MSDAVTLARTARESLARGLSALQSDPSIPPQLVELATPIAQAMAALHGIERSGGVQIQPAAQTALANVQGALAQLQSQPTQYPAVAAAMEAVAGALASAHALTRLTASAPQPQPSQAAAPPQVLDAATGSGRSAAASRLRTAAAAPAARVCADRHGPRPPGSSYVLSASPLAAAPPFFCTVSPSWEAAALAPAPGCAARHGSAVIAAELGAHSPSNFYKGLSGNDVVDHGGLFVSTYKLPKLGEMVRLRVSMPGGYEFEANAVVRWRREPSDTPGDAPPGFGAQLAEITADARQLVYRYVRNREPMFHDDL